MIILLFSFNHFVYLLTTVFVFIMQLGCNYFDWYYEEVADENNLFYMKQKRRLEVLTRVSGKQGQQLVEETKISQIMSKSEATSSQCVPTSEASPSTSHQFVTKEEFHKFTSKVEAYPKEFDKFTSKVEAYQEANNKKLDNIAKDQTEIKLVLAQLLVKLEKPQL